jgi:hypothetical protein
MFIVWPVALQLKKSKSCATHRDEEAHGFLVMAKLDDLGEIDRPRTTIFLEEKYQPLAQPLSS